MNNALDQVEAERIMKMGGAAVGKMEYLSLEEYTIISFLRRYCDGEISRQILKKELIINLGYSAGEKTFDCLKFLADKKIDVLFSTKTNIVFSFSTPRFISKSRYFFV